MQGRPELGGRDGTERNDELFAGVPESKRNTSHTVVWALKELTNFERFDAGGPAPHGDFDLYELTI